jgi:hypothetical protein
MFRTNAGLRLWRWSFGLFLAVCIPCHATTVIVYVAEIQGLFNKTEDGAYDKILLEAKRRKNLDFNMKLVSAPRGRALFQTDRKDCYSPANKKEYVDDQQVLASAPFNKAKVFVFTKKGDSKISSLHDLVGMTLGKVRGLRIDILNEVNDLKVEEVTQNKQLPLMLKLGRIDAFVDFAPDIIYTLSKTPSEKDIIDFDNKFYLFSADNSVICFQNKDTENFIQGLNGAIHEMYQDGTLKKILGDLYLLD